MRNKVAMGQEEADMKDASLLECGLIYILLDRGMQLMLCRWLGQVSTR